MPHSPKNILLVDDDNDFCLLIRMMFKKTNYTLIVQKTGQDALDYMQRAGKEDQPDLILLDIQMPGMSGFSFLDLIRKNACKIPVVAVTALVTTNDRIRATEVGFDDFLAKPFSEKELFSTIEPLMT